MGEQLSFSWSFLELRCGQNIPERIVNQTPRAAYPGCGCVSFFKGQMGL